eukprot:429541-Prymnesium_polylepis.1
MSGTCSGEPQQPVGVRIKIDRTRIRGERGRQLLVNGRDGLRRRRLWRSYGKGWRLTTAGTGW